MSKIGLVMLAGLVLALPSSIAFADTNVEFFSLRVDDKFIDTDLKTAPVLIVNLNPSSDISLVSMVLHVSADSQSIKISSASLSEFIVVADGARTIYEKQNEVLFYPEKSQVIFYIYGKLDQKNDTLFNLLKVSTSNTSDILAVIAKKNTDGATASPVPVPQVNSTQSPLLDKLDSIISNSNLPQGEKDSLLLKEENLKEMYQQGKSADADKLTLQLIDSYQNKSSQLQQDQFECDKSKVKIAELEDHISSSKIPDNLLVSARQNLEYAKNSYQSGLCNDGYTYAEKGLEQLNSIDPITSFNASFPYALSGGLVFGVAIGAIVAVKKMRGESFTGGMR